MRMKRIHAIELAREVQREENRKRVPATHKKGILGRLLNVKNGRK
jgi:hypothetical protein